MIALSPISRRSSSSRRKFSVFSIIVTAGLLLLLLQGFLWSPPLSLPPWGPYAPTPRRTPGLSRTAMEEIFLPSAINNTVVIVPVNTGYTFWAENLLCSLSSSIPSFDTSKIVFWALDAQAEEYHARKGRAVYHDPSLFSASGDENLRGDTKAYKKMMKERPKFFLDVLSAGFDMLLLDADTVFWRSPLETIVPFPAHRHELGNDRVDAVFSTDAREFYQDHNAFQDERRRGPFVPPICNGIFWMRSSPQTISLWREMLEVFESWKMYTQFGREEFQDDQRGMDVLLNDGRAQLVGPFPRGVRADMVPKRPSARMDLFPDRAVNVRLLDQTSVVNGHLLKNRHGAYVENLAALRAGGGERIGAHFNWWTKEVSKKEGAREFDMLFVDERGECYR